MTVSISCPWCDDQQPLDLQASEEFHCAACGTSVLIVEEEPAYALELAA